MVLDNNKKTDGWNRIRWGEGGEFVSRFEGKRNSSTPQAGARRKSKSSLSTTCVIKETAVTWSRQLPVYRLLLYRHTVAHCLSHSRTRCQSAVAFIHNGMSDAGFL